QLAEEDLEGDPIRRQVMDRQQVEVLSRGKAHQGDAQERPALEVEGLARVVVDRLIAGGLAQLGRQGGEIDHRHVRHEVFMDALHRPAVYHRKRGAPRRVPPDQRMESAAEKPDVQLAQDAAAGVDVPGDETGIIPVELPEPLLIKGQGPVADAGSSGDRAHRRRLERLGGRDLLLLAAQRIEEGTLLRSEDRKALGDAHTGASISASLRVASSGERPSTRARRASRSSGLSSPRARAISLESSAMVGASKSAVTARSASNSERIWVTIWMASSECPPSSRKLSSMPIGAMPNSSSHSAASRCSRSSRGGA